MPAKRTFSSARFRGPVQFDSDLNHHGVPVAALREFIGVISQNGANAPEVTDTIKNTLGAPIVFTRDSAGHYFGTIPVASRALKLLPYNIPVWNGDYMILLTVVRGSTELLEIIALDPGGGHIELNVGGVPLNICMYP